MLKMHILKFDIIILILLCHSKFNVHLNKDILEIDEILQFTVL